MTSSRLLAPLSGLASRLPVLNQQKETTSRTYALLRTNRARSQITKHSFCMVNCYQLRAPITKHSVCTASLPATDPPSMFLCYNSRQRAKKVFTLDGDPVKTWRLAFSVYGLAPALAKLEICEITPVLDGFC
jgi:hypothetical protein